MYRHILRAKIHRARVTEANLDYIGSITIDQSLLEAAEILPNEQVEIYNITNGERLSTYVVTGEPNSGVICVNGAAAHKVSKGDLIIICNYALMDSVEARQHQPKLIFVDDQNRQVSH